jgi:hypothetical protein
MPLLTAEEAADKLRVPVVRLKGWRAAGQGPAFIRLSHKTVLYDDTVLDAFIASRVCKPAVEQFFADREASRQGFRRL